VSPLPGCVAHSEKKMNSETLLGWTPMDSPFLPKWLSLTKKTSFKNPRANLSFSP
jgi:hypothetical protein